MNLLSIVIPIYNEEKNIQELFSRLKTSLSNQSYEIIAINDGSRDGSWQELKKAAATDRNIKAINFARNSGQTSAINAGIQHATGDIIVLIDSDLENDPADIPLLLAKLNEGYDVVSGWRKYRWKGQFITRKLPSMMANKLISSISGVHLNDYGCTLKVYRRSVIQHVRLYGEMHRFIPVYTKWYGGKVAEVPVNYFPRKHGKSNYGISRIYKVILDLLLIRFLDRYMNKPIHFFGGAGLLCTLAAIILAAAAVYLKIAGIKNFSQTQLVTISAFMGATGVQLILIGILSEILMRTYYESQDKTPYLVRDKLNLP